MRKLGKGRRELFAEIDRPALKPLPAEPYQYAEWRRARVAPDYHIEVRGHFYSVIRQVVDVRVTEMAIEVSTGAAASPAMCDLAGRTATPPSPSTCRAPSRLRSAGSAS
jgi:hypothetical protein